MIARPKLSQIEWKPIERRASTKLANVSPFSSRPGKQASRAVGVPLYYGFVEAVGIGVFLLVAWKRGMTHAPSDAPVCDALRKNWQDSGHDRGRAHRGDDEEAGGLEAAAATDAAHRDGDARPPAPTDDDGPSPLPAPTKPLVDRDDDGGPAPGCNVGCTPDAGGDGDVSCAVA